MKLLYKPKAWGKTTRLLKLAKEINGIIIVPDLHLKEYLIKTKQIKRDSCYSICEVTQGALSGRATRLRPILVDNADMILENLIGSTITMCTMTKTISISEVEDGLVSLCKYQKKINELKDYIKELEEKIDFLDPVGVDSCGDCDIAIAMNMEDLEDIKEDIED